MSINAIKRFMTELTLSHTTFADQVSYSLSACNSGLR